MLAAFQQSQLWLNRDIGTVKTKGVHHIHLESLTASEKVDQVPAIAWASPGITPSVARG